MKKLVLVFVVAVTFAFGSPASQGAQNLPEDWQGGIDEVRAARVAPSADWLRLSYLNQVAGSKLVTPFRP